MLVHPGLMELQVQVWPGAKTLGSILPPTLSPLFPPLQPSFSIILTEVLFIAHQASLCSDQNRVLVKTPLSFMVFRGLTGKIPAASFYLELPRVLSNHSRVSTHYSVTPFEV
jgi:hypothetical protein